MKAMADDEKAFSGSDKLDEKMAAYVSAKKRFIKVGFALAFAALAASIVLHWIFADHARPISGSLAGLGLGLFFLTVLGAFSIRRIPCPQCGKKMEHRGQHTGQGGDEQVIAICRRCKVQSPTGMVISG